jgi:hypothetical protein
VAGTREQVVEPPRFGIDHRQTTDERSGVAGSVGDAMTTPTRFRGDQQGNGRVP